MRIATDRIEILFDETETKINLTIEELTLFVYEDLIDVMAKRIHMLHNLAKSPPKQFDLNAKMHNSHNWVRNGGAEQ
ncbi:hypothetical protein [Vibrio mediterranei]|uniref:hypothetical protein n=1 Tax=Vibrio mediterranei TaxID=689 RepID=UPI004068C8BA